MKRVWLIGANVVREQRWFLLLMLVYIASITVLLHFVEERSEDSLVIVRQEAIYGTFFSVVISASLFQNERKTRRIVAVLSKAVSRGEYIAGAIGGVNVLTLLYQIAVFASLFVLFPHASVRTAAAMMLYMLAAGLLVSVVTVLFTTFLHPLFATAAAGLLLASPLLFDKLGWPTLGRVLPSVALLKHALAFTPEKPLPVDLGMLALALAESAFLGVLASWIFARRDITTAVE